MEITHDPLPPEAQAIADKGEPVRLFDWTNVAYGTPGYWVRYLVRIGLWEQVRRHEAVDPMHSFNEYAPISASELGARRRKRISPKQFFAGLP